MKNLAKPDHKVSNVFEDCLKVRRSKELRDRLTCVKLLIEKAESEYDKAATTCAFFGIQETSGVGTCVTAEEMEKLYTEVFARKTSPIRSKYYDELLLAPENGICPFCGQRTVSTLDHYLPKAKNPSLAVTPVNLVPACHECNHIKDEHHPKIAGQQLIHPYFDVLEDEKWLFANVQPTRPPAMTYLVSPPDTWDETSSARLIWQFEKLELAKLYASQAGSTLSGIAEKLKSAGMRGGAAEIKFILEEDARSWEKAWKNSWQSAMYRALADSNWFCTEGYAFAGEKVKKKSGNVAQIPTKAA